MKCVRGEEKLCTWQQSVPANMLYRADGWLTRQWVHACKEGQVVRLGGKLGLSQGAAAAWVGELSHLSGRVVVAGPAKRPEEMVPMGCGRAG